MSYHIHVLVASLTLMAPFKNGAIRVRLGTSIWYHTLMKNCFKDWSQSSCNHAFSMEVEKSVDPDQMASSEAS